jgi:hypothetical protein
MRRADAVMVTFFLCKIVRKRNKYFSFRFLDMFIHLQELLKIDTGELN